MRKAGHADASVGANSGIVRRDGGDCYDYTAGSFSRREFRNREADSFVS